MKWASLKHIVNLHNKGIKLHNENFKGENTILNNITDNRHPFKYFLHSILSHLLSSVLDTILNQNVE